MLNISFNLSHLKCSELVYFAKDANIYIYDFCI